MISNKFKDRFSFFLKPIGERLGEMGVSPNHLTIAGMVLSIVAGLLIALNAQRWAALLVIVGGLCDSLDGAVARETEKVTPFGAFLDSTLDRYSDLALYLGVIVLAYLKRDTSLLLWTALAMAGAIMVSYTRARAECLIEKCQVGLMERPERIILLLIGLIFHWLIGAMVITALLANATAIHRIYHTYKELRTKGEPLS